MFLERTAQEPNTKSSLIELSTKAYMKPKHAITRWKRKCFLSRGRLMVTVTVYVERTSQCYDRKLVFKIKISAALTRHLDLLNSCTNT